MIVRLRWCLRIGAFAAFFVMLAGVLAAVVVDGRIATRIELAGVLIMLITPVARVFVAMVLVSFVRRIGSMARFLRACC